MKLVGKIDGGACVIYLCERCGAIWESCMGERRAKEVTRDYVLATYPNAQLGDG